MTRSVGNVLFELDGEPALDLYERYLGPRSNGLPGSALLFPIQVYDVRRPDSAVVRTVLAIDRDARSMTFAGDVPQGWTAQLMRGNFDRLAAGAADAARQARAALDARYGVRPAKRPFDPGQLHRPAAVDGPAHHDEVEAAGAELGPDTFAARVLLLWRDFATRRIGPLRAAQSDHDGHDPGRGCLNSVGVGVGDRRAQTSCAAGRQGDGRFRIARSRQALELVGAAYEEADRDRRRTDRSMSLMIEELDGFSEPRTDRHRAHQGTAGARSGTGRAEHALRSGARQHVAGPGDVRWRGAPRHLQPAII